MYKQDFPIFSELSHGKPLVYLDSAATTQKPKMVIEAVQQYYCHDNANVHRGIYELSERATAQYEIVRDKVQHFIHAEHREEIIFVKGTTEAINLVAHCFAASNIQAGEEIIISAMEHHSNIVPWQIVCERYGARLRVIDLNAAGEIDQAHYQRLLSEKTKLVAVAHVSNVLGTVNPVQSMIALAHQYGAQVLIDGAQAAPHMPVDVEALDCDYYAFSSHKMYGPTGVGVLYGKKALLESLPPYQAGGDMIRQVTFEKTDYNVLPYKFEAGTPNMAGVIGLGAAIDYVNSIGLQTIHDYEQNLLTLATTELTSTIKGLRILGTADKKASVISFLLDGIHPHDIASILDSEGVAVRAGHHCAMPLMQYYKVPATIRASFGLYNNESDIERLLAGLQLTQSVFVS